MTTAHTEWAELCRGPEKQILPLPSDHPYVGTAEALHVTLIALIYCVSFHGLQKIQAYFFVSYSILFSMNSPFKMSKISSAMPTLESIQDSGTIILLANFLAAASGIDFKPVSLIK